jgi:hypothetical protein
MHSSRTADPRHRVGLPRQLLCQYLQGQGSPHHRRPYRLGRASEKGRQGLVDPSRSPSSCFLAVCQSKVDAHEGSKSSKAVYLGAKDYILTVGFTKQSQRQLKIWDTRNLDTEVKSLEIDQAAGVIMPFFDPDSNLLYLAGKVGRSSGI